MPLLPFAVGLLAGVFTVRLARNNKTRAGLDKAQARLREATVSGLTALESSSARLRDKLAAGEASGDTPAALPAAGAAPVAKPPRKRAPRKPAAKARTEPVARPEPAGDAS